MGRTNGDSLRTIGGSNDQQFLDEFKLDGSQGEHFGRNEKCAKRIAARQLLALAAAAHGQRYGCEIWRGIPGQETLEQSSQSTASPCLHPLLRLLDIRVVSQGVCANAITALTVIRSIPVKRNGNSQSISLPSEWCMLHPVNKANPRNHRYRSQVNELLIWCEACIYAHRALKKEMVGVAGCRNMLHTCSRSDFAAASSKYTTAS